MKEIQWWAEAPRRLNYLPKIFSCSSFILEVYLKCVAGRVYFEKRLAISKDNHTFSCLPQFTIFLIAVEPKSRCSKQKRVVSMSIPAACLHMIQYRCRTHLYYSCMQKYFPLFVMCDKTTRPTPF